MSKRKQIPTSVLQDVLVKSRRRCCMCVAEDDVELKEGLVTILDEAAEAKGDNLAYLCLKHHAAFDRGLLRSTEIKSHQAAFYSDVEKDFSIGLVTPKVFISYAWTDEDHKNWVVEFASRLMSDGVEVILDVWDLKEGHDKYKFMERMVSDETVTKVLAICDKKYAEKADGRAGGVGTESQIISPEVYNKTDQEKFIPIIRERDGNGVEFVPVFFKGKKYFDFSNDEDFEGPYDALIRNLYGKPDRVKPVLGKPPAHLLGDSGPVVRAAGKFERLKSAVLGGKPFVQAALQDYLDTFLETMEEFRITESPRQNELFDEKVMKNLTDFIPHRDNFVEFLFFVSSYLDVPEAHERIQTFLEHVADLKERPEDVRTWNEATTDNYRFIGYELFLYTVATFIKARRFRTAASYIEHDYYVKSMIRGVPEYYATGIAAFNEHNTALDHIRNQRLKLNLISVVADTVMKRVTNKKIHARDILQADLLLCLRSFFPEPAGARGWYPRCAVYLVRGGTLELFSRATTAGGLKALQELLKVTGYTDLTLGLNRFIKEYDFDRSSSFGLRLLKTTIGEVLNFDAILQMTD